MEWKSLVSWSDARLESRGVTEAITVLAYLEEDIDCGSLITSSHTKRTVSARVDEIHSPRRSIR